MARPIASLKWGAMTMDFKLPKGGVPRGLEAGDRIDFEFYMGAENPAAAHQHDPAAGGAEGFERLPTG